MPATGGRPRGVEQMARFWVLFGPRLRDPGCACAKRGQFRAEDAPRRAERQRVRAGPGRWRRNGLEAARPVTGRFDPSPTRPLSRSVTGPRCSRAVNGPLDPPLNKPAQRAPQRAAQRAARPVASSDRPAPARSATSRDPRAQRTRAPIGWPAWPTRSPWRTTAAFPFPTSPSFPSSKATAQASISGRQPSWYSTPPPTSTASRSPGRRCSPARRRSRKPATGFPKRPSTSSGSTSSASRVR